MSSPRPKKPRHIFAFVMGLLTWLLCLLVLGFSFILPHLNAIEAYENAAYSLTLAAFFVLGAILICECLSLIIDKFASHTTVLLILSAIGVELFSSDGVRFFLRHDALFDVADWLFPFLRVFFFYGFLASLWLFFVQTYLPKRSKKSYFLLTLFFALGAVSSLVSSLFGFEILTIPFSLPSLLYGTYLVRRSLKGNQERFNQIPYLAFHILVVIFASEVLNCLSAWVPESMMRTNGLTSILMYWVAALFLSVYGYYLFIVTRQAAKEKKNQEQIALLQKSVLHNQIGPHFYFNALQVIRDLYAESKEKGDRGISLLGVILRNYLQSSKKPLVPLSEELDSVSSFIEFEELKKGRQIPIVYNVECDDFQVPFLSLQPLVENAIRYSGIEKKEDGHIEISVLEEESNYLLSVADNGVGFDLSKAKRNSIALSNVKERIALLLHGSMEAFSKEGEGTLIKILIPKEREQK